MQLTQVNTQAADTLGVRYQDPVAGGWRVRGVVPSVHPLDKVGAAGHMYAHLATENNDVTDHVIVAEEFDCGRTGFGLCVVHCGCTRAGGHEQM